MKKMPLKMKLLSDAVFGSGFSVPGDADIFPQVDDKRFPYMKGSTFKGVFRETLESYLMWQGMDGNEILQKISGLLGTAGSNLDSTHQLVFSDFVLSEAVREKMLELPEISSDEITDTLTNLRTFTRLDEQGMAEDGSLRNVRCINKGLIFYSTIVLSDPEDQDLVRDVLGMIKWVGTMRNRGFGKVKIEEVDEK